MVIFLKNYQLKEQPIGIFDSGVGGLTVAHAIKQVLPGESLIYFGDTAHLPYGDKSAESIRYYSGKITEFLLTHNSKVVLVACNSASASAFESLKQQFQDKTILIDVIDPVVDYLGTKNFRKIGVIGTKRTITSGSYDQKLKEKSPHTKVISMATPLFVPMIEEGFIFDDISNAIIRSYLSKPELSQIQALILGCTHYPIIKNQINKFFNFEVDVIDSSKIVANHLRNILAANDLINAHPNPSHKFYVSDFTEYFQVISKLFFEENIVLEKINLWH